MKIHINNTQDKEQIDTGYWENFSQKLLILLTMPDNTEVSITFVDNEEIHSLNKEYRNKDKATDVLSFPFESTIPLPVKILGDVIISTEKIREQAEEYGHSLGRETGFLITHGILHLLGYDHETPEQEREMFALQKKLLSNFDL